MKQASLLFVLLLWPVISAYNILIIHPTASHSHQVPVMALTEALVKRGHQLFVVAPNSVAGLERNYTFVDMSFTYTWFPKLFEEKMKEGTLKNLGSRWGQIDIAPIYASVAPEQFKSKPFLQFQKRVVDEKISFDVSVVESFFTPHGCAMTRFLSGHDTPIITMSTNAAVFYGEDDQGSPLHLSYLPSLLSSYPHKMSLWQKIDNWFFHHYVVGKMKGAMEDSARRYFRENHGPKYESLVDGCWSNVSLAMISSNFIYYAPRLLGPNIVEIGPLHLKPPEKLPQDLQDWLDGADKGVIYFSLGGSSMLSKDLPEDARANFLKFFRELPLGYRVLWKWELDGKIPGQSANVLGQKWLPQQSVLAHPKVKVFITQGGLQSFQETVHFGVPTVGIPFSADQGANVAKMVDAGVGVSLQPTELNSYEKVKSALEAVLQDEKYTKHMIKLSEISREFTDQALDKAVYWIEHIAKHGHAYHLRPSTADTTYFQFFCLDIITVILVVSLTTLYILILVCRFFLSAISSSPRRKIKKP